MKYRILLILMVLSLLPAILISATLSVKQDGSGDYTIIQEALDAANPGDTVLVHPGRYYENLIIDESYITLMSLEGIGGDSEYIDTTVIDGNNSNPCIIISQHALNNVIRGLSITNGWRGGGNGGGLSMGLGSITSLKNCKIFENTASTGGGIGISSSKVFLYGTSIYNNYASLLGGGVYASYATEVHPLHFDSINRCSIYNNRAGSGQDIYIQHVTNDLELPLDTFSVANPSSYHATYLTDTSSTGYRINFDIQNAHYQELDCDLYVSTTGSDDNDGISPATALKTIHEAIYRVAADSLNQNTVHILPGEYSRTDNEQILPIALKSWVIVKGAGIDTTTVICEPHPVIPLIYGSWDTIFDATRVDGATLADMTFLSRDTIDCGVLLGNRYSTVNLINLRIDEFFPDYAEIIYLSSSSVRETVWDNVTIENVVTPKAGLVNVYIPMSGTVKNCVFRNSRSTYMSQSVPARSLVSIAGDKSLVFENCEFTNLSMMDDDSRCFKINSAQYPRQQNHFVFQNCLFSGNESEGSIGIIGSSNNPRIDITNCTFAGNTSDNYILMLNGEVSITNSIFHNDSPYEIKVNPMDYNPNEYTHLKIDHSLIKGGIDGIIPYPRPGNTIDFLPSSFDADPLFMGIVNPSNPLHYALSESSPCIDSGTPDISGLNLPPYDLAGNWRVWNDRIDLGCFEFASEPWVSNEDSFIPPLQHFVLHQNYPNPFNPETTISFELEEPDFVSIEIFNTKGQKIRKLLEKHYGAGHHNIAWDGCDEQGRAVSSGVYFYKMQTAQKSQSRKMLMLK